jgi:hypothetical protein
MNVYIYQADLLCEECGEAERNALGMDGNAPADPDDESSYDSDEYPKGPFPDGGGEADCPNHCGNCHVFLENPLTSDGEAYVREAVERAWSRSGGGNREVIDEWVEFYGIRPAEPDDQYDEEEA